MSIRDSINGHIGKELFLLPPLIASEESKRTMLVGREMLGATLFPDWTGKDAYRLGKLRGDLDRFITGAKIAIALYPRRKPPTTYLARLEPVHKEIWEIRSCDPKPGVRVLGRFSEKDTFIALCWDFHENLKGRSWDLASDRCRQEWIRLFPGLSPNVGSTASDYLSNKFFSV
jgi:hypothetical protein